jgi:hypothetical protein
LKERTQQENELLEKEYFEIKGDNTSQKEGGNIVGYASQRKGSTGAFSKNGFLNKKEISTIKDDLRKTKSTVWTGVLSFTPTMAQAACRNAEDAQKLIKTYLPAICKGSKLQFENLNYLGAFHINTDNPHIHIVFWEDKPTRYDSYGRLNYNYNKKNSLGYIPLESLQNFKIEIAKGFSNLNYDFLNIRDDVRSRMRNDILDNASSGLIKTLCERDKTILQSNKKQYARLTATERIAIDRSVLQIIANNPKLREAYNLYDRKLKEAQADTIKMFEENNVTPPKKAQNFYSSRKSELSARLGNEYLRAMREWGKEFNIFDKNRIRAEKPFNGKSTSSCLNAVRAYKKPFARQTNSFFKSFTKSMTAEVKTSNNDLKQYFAKLKAKGVTLIYDNDEEQA